VGSDEPVPPRFHWCVSPFLSILFLPCPLPKTRERSKAYDDRTPGDSDDDDTKAAQVRRCLTLFYLISDSHCPSLSPLPDAHHTPSRANTLRMREGAQRRRKRGDSLSLTTGTSPLLSFTLTLTSPQGMNMRRKCGRHVPNDAGQGATPQRYVHPLSSLSPPFHSKDKTG